MMSARELVLIGAREVSIGAREVSIGAREVSIGAHSHEVSFDEEVVSIDVVCFSLQILRSRRARSENKSFFSLFFLVLLGMHPKRQK